MEKRRLGRGLDALIAGGGQEAESGAVAVAGAATRVPVGRIDHNPYQPRKAFDQDELSALSDSIRTVGILQPLVVRQVGDRYQLIAGERRLRAAQAAGLGDVPVRVMDFNDQQVLEAALVENIQRTDLNPIEKAQGFNEYLQRFKMTHEELAKRLGLERSTVTNLVRLLELQPEVQEAVRVGQISASHAKALLAVTDRQRQVSLCKEIIARGHSVHATEALVKGQKAEPEAAGPRPPAPEKTAHVQAIEDELRHKLATRVEIRVRGKDRGQVILSFESNDDFDRLMEVLRGPANH
ncbi:MAG: ParB/RepB/Spo0J family partition protein [Planctomycetota bacterium]|nr:MAG: ParB/RepB/Spo0J family partition protein [Planctomycetota bacterium]